jgi:hypothetical protein
MRLATLILPTHDNDGESLNDVHSALRADIADAFGGFTAYATTGAWRNGNSVVTESGVAYDIAHDTVTLQGHDSRETLESLARFHGRVARQECVYLAFRDAEVLFVSCSYRVAHDSRDAIESATV